MPGFQKKMQNLLGSGAFDCVVGCLADKFCQFGSVGIDSFDTVAELFAFGGFLLENDFCALCISDFDICSLLNVVELHDLLPNFVG